MDVFPPSNPSIDPGIPESPGLQTDTRDSCNRVAFFSVSHQEKTLQLSRRLNNQTIWANLSSFRASGSSGLGFYLSP